MFLERNKGKLVIVQFKKYIEMFVLTEKKQVYTSIHNLQFAYLECELPDVFDEIFPRYILCKLLV